MTSKQPGNHQNVYGGVDTSSKPHLLEPSNWVTGTNIRFYNGANQLPRKKTLCQLRSTTSDPILCLSAVPKGSGRSLLVAMSAKQIWQVTATSGSNVGLEILRDNNILEFATDGKYRRWSTVMYKGHLYFTNELNSLRYTDGGQCYKLGENTPSGRYVSNVFDHMWLAWVKKDGHTFPTRLHWSHLYNFGEWTPQATNEADYYDFEEYCGTDVPVRGITGLAKLGDHLIVYTPSAIIPVAYVGLPKVVRVLQPVSLDVGNGLPWTLVPVGNRHYFFDVRAMNFFSLTMEGVKPIGNKIQTWLAANLKTTTPDDIQSMWGFHDAANKEVVWVFKSVSSTGAHDKYVAYNQTNGEWEHGSCEDIHSFHPGCYRAKTVSQLSGTNTLQSGQVQDLANSSETFPRIYGSSNASILRDEISADTTASLKDVAGPVLETGDLVYGDIDSYKELDSLVIHAQWTTATNLKVEYAVRDNLEDTVTWVEIDQRWTPNLPEKRLSFPRIAGRIFRFRFTPIGTAATTTVTTRQVLSPSFTLRAELIGSGIDPDPDPDPDPEPEPEPIDDTHFKKFDGPVYSMHPSLIGNFLYVTGRFTQYGNNIEGWTPCKGIAKIDVATGEIDPTFNPGGVVGGGFDISGGYFAPTQVQGAADGGCFVGMGYAFLPEPLLYQARGAASNYHQLSLNGVAVPPVMKLGPTGTVDATFSAAALVSAATDPVFMSFHMFEAVNCCYYSYRKDIVATSPNAVTSYTGVNRPTLDLRRLNGDLVRRAWINSAMDIGIVDRFQQVFVEHETSQVFWGGITASASGADLLLTVGNNESLAMPQSWKMFTLEHGGPMGIISFNLALELDEAADWAGLDRGPVLAGAVTDMVPLTIRRGCFRGAIIGSCSIVDDPGASPREGAWRSGAVGRHKGCIHFNFRQSFQNYDRASGTGTADVISGVTIMSDQGGFTFRAYGERFGSDNIFLRYAPGTPDEVVLDSFNGGQEQEEFDVADFPGVTTPNPGEVEVTTGGPTNWSWELHTPYFKPTTGPWHLWDLRNGGVDPEDTLSHGFGIFAGATYDRDGCPNMQCLYAMHDSSNVSAQPTTSPNLGVYFAGEIEKFKGETKFVAHGQMCKVRHNGLWEDNFTAPTVGPDSFTLKQNISAGADETHYCKVIFCTLSRSGRYLYVGGKFTEVEQDGTTHLVGHIMTINANTGAYVG